MSEFAPLAGRPAMRFHLIIHTNPISDLKLSIIRVKPHSDYRLTGNTVVVLILRHSKPRDAVPHKQVT